MNLITVINEIIALVLLILLGFVSFKFKVFNQQSSQLISGMVIKITLPLLVIVSMNRKFSGELLHNTLMLIGISIIIYIVLILFAEIWSLRTKKPHEKSAVLKWIVVFGNCAFMGYPVINALYGSLGVFYAAIFNIVYNFLLFSYGIAILQQGSKKLSWKSLMNPGMVATIIGFALFVFQITIPSLLLRPMSMISDMTIPLALILTGIGLAQIPIREFIHPLDIWITSFLRLVIFPFIILLILPMFHLNQYLIAVPAILMGTPTALTAGAFALNYGLDHQLASKGVVLSNFLSLITMPGLVWVIIMLFNNA